MAFDPKAYLASNAPSLPKATAPVGFDPKAYLAKNDPQSTAADFQQAAEEMSPALDLLQNASQGIAMLQDKQRLDSMNQGERMGLAGLDPSHRLTAATQGQGERINAAPLLPQVEDLLAPVLGRDKAQALTAMHPVESAIYDTTAGLSTPENIAIAAGVDGLALLSKAGVPLTRTALNALLAHFAMVGAKSAGEDYATYLETLDDPKASLEDVLKAGFKIPLDVGMTAGLAGLRRDYAGERLIDRLRDKPIPDAPIELPAPVPPAIAENAGVGPIAKPPTLVEKLDSIPAEANHKANNAAINAAIINPPAVQPMPVVELPAPSPIMPVPAALEGLASQKASETPPESQIAPRAKESAAPAIPTKAQDIARYKEVQAKISEMVKAQDPNLLANPDFRALWTENEEIKNRHGGMPPVEDSAPAKTGMGAIVADTQKSAGWNPQWPFVPQDLSNKTFAEGILADSSLPDNVKRSIFTAARKLGVGTLTAKEVNARLTNPKSASAPDTTPAADLVLPRELKGAKPRYSYGVKQFTLKFDSELDKSLYILAQSVKSKADAKYLKAVADHTGMTEAQAREAGMIVRERIKQLAKKSKGGELVVPTTTTTSNAVQKQSPAPLDVQPAPGNGEAVGAAHRVDQGPAKPRKQAGKLSKKSPSAPAEGKVASGGGGKEPPAPPAAPPASNPNEPHGEGADKLRRQINKILASPSIDVGVKREIGEHIAKQIPNGVEHLEALNNDHITRLRQELAEMAMRGRALVKEREAQYTVRRDAIARDIQGYEGRLDNDLEQDLAIGRREGVAEELKRKIANKLKIASNVLNSKFGDTLVSDIVFDRADGDANYKGPIWRYFQGLPDYNYNIIEHGLRRDFSNPIKDLIKRFGIDSKAMERVNVYAINAREGGRQHLIDSGMTEPQIDAIVKSITPDEKAFYGGVREILDNKIYPMVRDFMHRVFNVDVAKDANYWPFQRDWGTYDKTAKVEQAKAVKDMMSGYDGLEGFIGNLQEDFQPLRTTTPKKGFTIARRPEGRGAVRVKDNLLESHVNAVAHLLAHAETTKMLGQIARQQWFLDKYGKNFQNYVLDHLDTITRDSDPLGATRLRLLDALASNTAVGILALRVFSQLKHASNFIIAASEVRPQFLAMGIRDSFSGPGPSFIRRFAPEIFERGGGEEAITELMRGTTWNKFQAGTFAIERGLDQAIARATFLGKYMEGLAKRGIDPRQYAELPLHKDAYHEALLSARKATTSPLRKDAPHAVSRGSWFNKHMTLTKIIFQFQRTMMRIGGHAKHEIWDMGVTKRDYGHAAFQAAVYLMVLAATAGITLANKKFMGAVKQHVLNGPAPKADTTSTASEVGHEMLLETARLIPGVSQISSMVTRGQTGVPLYQGVLDLAAAAGRLGSGKNQYGGKQSPAQRKYDAATVGGALGALVGVPGATTMAELYKGSINPSSRWHN